VVTRPQPRQQTLLLALRTEDHDTKLGIPFLDEDCQLLHVKVRQPMVKDEGLESSFLEQRQCLRSSQRLFYYTTLPDQLLEDPLPQLMIRACQNH
jgi:hypothetical protein